MKSEKRTERLEPIVENSACVEAGTTISQTPAKRCQFEQFQLYYLRRGEICGIEAFFQLLDTSYVRATRELEKKGRIFPYFSKTYKNALKEDFIRVVKDLDGTVESTDTIVKLKTKIENSSTFESDPDFVKTLIQNCIDERVSRNEREVTLEKQKIELAKLQLAKLEKEVELQRAKNKALSLNLAAKVEENQFETLNKDTATHIGIREAEDWFRPIDLAKECDIYISQNFKPKIKENYPQYLERENKNCFICGDSSHFARDCEKRFKPKASNDHIHNRINVNTLKIESEKQNSDEFAQQFQYVNNFVENQPVTALIDSGCQIPVLNSSLIRVQTPSEEIITLSSCFGEQRMVEVKPINISLDQHSPSLSSLSVPFFFVCFRFSSGIHGKEKRQTYRCGQRTDVATELGLAPSDNLKIIELRDLIINSDRYDEEFVKNMLSVIVEERTATEKQKAAELGEKQKAVCGCGSATGKRI
ncbi:hypothetical protein TNCV_2286631 [Trichonephila clavipes]|nr:hypothetical protein TNCV_2286631 [Trichonephila clavipes]